MATKSRTRRFPKLVLASCTALAGLPLLVGMPEMSRAAVSVDDLDNPEICSDGSETLKAKMAAGCKADTNGDGIATTREFATQQVQADSTAKATYDRLSQDSVATPDAGGSLDWRKRADASKRSMARLGSVAHKPEVDTSGFLDTTNSSDVSSLINQYTVNNSTYMNSLANNNTLASGIANNSSFKTNLTDQITNDTTFQNSLKTSMESAGIGGKDDRVDDYLAEMGVDKLSDAITVATRDTSGFQICNKVITTTESYSSYSLPSTFDSIEINVSMAGGGSGGSQWDEQRYGTGSGGKGGTSVVVQGGQVLRSAGSDQRTAFSFRWDTESSYMFIVGGGGGAASIYISSNTWGACDSWYTLKSYSGGGGGAGFPGGQGGVGVSHQDYPTFMSCDRWYYNDPTNGTNYYGGHGGSTNTSASEGAAGGSMSNGGTKPTYSDRDDLVGDGGSNGGNGGQGTHDRFRVAAGGGGGYGSGGGGGVVASQRDGYMVNRGSGGLGANNWSSATKLPDEAGASGKGVNGGNAGLIILTYEYKQCVL